MDIFVAIWRLVYTCIYLPTDQILKWVGDLFDLSMDILFNLPAYTIEFLIVNTKPLLQVLILPGLAFILVFAIIAVWFERKFLARAMLRVGPYYCGKRSGVLQVFADFLKLFMKDRSGPHLDTI